MLTKSIITLALLSVGFVQAAPLPDGSSGQSTDLSSQSGTSSDNVEPHNAVDLSKREPHLRLPFAVPTGPIKKAPKRETVDSHFLDQPASDTKNSGGKEHGRPVKSPAKREPLQRHKNIRKPIKREERRKDLRKQNKREERRKDLRKQIKREERHKDLRKQTKREERHKDLRKPLKREPLERHKNPRKPTKREPLEFALPSLD